MTEVPATKTPPPPWDDIPWEQWEDWRWQLANRLTTVEQICEVVHLTEAEEIENSVKKMSESNEALVSITFRQYSPLQQCPEARHLL